MRKRAVCFQNRFGEAYYKIEWNFIRNCLEHFHFVMDFCN